MSPQSTTSNQVAARQSYRDLSFLALSTVVPLTALFSILALSFKTTASTSYIKATDRGFRTTVVFLRPDALNGGLSIALYPQHLDLGPIQLTLAGDGLSLASALSIGLLCVSVCRRAKSLLLADWQRYGIFLVLAVNGVLSLAVFISCAVRRFNSGQFKPGYRSPVLDHQTYGPSNRYDGAMFDLGSWSCQLSAYDALEGGQDVLSEQCTNETAALWIGLVLALLDIVMAALVWIDWNGKRLLIRDYKSLKEEEEIYYI
ncbi:uncharacterized protein JN550_013258 [Neoarthrinium moseri]|uniref:uncharacterized protein n=1 Tax=Neoarthrinium moseri TaxID=1658444 RepID=UPI001FDDF41C|nr:uncharacterized protein JN550_013258 [Neoarthrinium moseri]KAI1857378.1 hypothetical protein JN550_013258 [Neoarthrinium moseri]